MKNVIILGSGRSGTSLTAGLLASAGYFMGEEMVPPSIGNPKGFFECVKTNRLNDELLAPVLPKRPRFFGRFMRQSLPRRAGAVDRWVAALPAGTRLPSPTMDQRKQIEAFCQRSPFCFKDPRFSYTLPLWQPHLANTVFVVVFRHPVQTACSILKELEQPEFRHLVLTEAEAIENIRCMYEHILREQVKSGDWLFVHYDQILEGSALGRLESFTGAMIDRRFPEQSLRRSSGADAPIPESMRGIYAALSERAGYSGGKPT